MQHRPFAQIRSGDIIIQEWPRGPRMISAASNDDNTKHLCHRGVICLHSGWERALVCLCLGEREKKKPHPLAEP